MERVKHTTQKLAKQLDLALTNKTHNIARAAEAILLNPADIDDASYQHAILCQVGMPRKRTPGLTFERRNGAAALLVEAGRLWDGRRFVQQALPYGAKARLVLINLTTEAIRKRSRVVDVGRSTREFMLRVGLDDQGSEYRSLKAQMKALAACRIQLAAQIGNRITHVNPAPIIHSIDMWLTPDLDQRTLWPGTIELTQQYYESCVKNATPLDERAIAALSGSALALDVYTWLSHRLWRIRDRKGVLVSWSALYGQFGTEYRREKDFKKTFLIALHQVMAVYPAAKIEERPEGLLLRTSQSPIPRPALVTGV